MAQYDDGFEYFRYRPSVVAAYVFTSIFVSLTLLHTYQLLRTKIWVLLPFVIGGLFEAAGYLGRVICANETPHWTLGPYIQQALLLLIAPALFAASIYMILGRIILITEGEAHAIIPRKWLTKGFVLSDILSFCIQGAGGGIMAGNSKSAYDMGEIVIIVGLVLQVIGFGFFIFTATIFHYRLLRKPTNKIVSKKLPWVKHLLVLYMASAMILVRCIFRLVEYAQGNGGYLISHEAFLYVFDACLMMCVMMTLGWWHPSEVYTILKTEQGRKER